MPVIGRARLLPTILLPLLLLSGGCSREDSVPDDDETIVRLALDWSTYWGGSGGDGATRGNALAVAANGDVVVVGESQSPSFFVKNPVQANPQRASKGFVTRFAANGQDVIYSTRIGSSGGYEWCIGVAIDAGGNALVVGHVSGEGFPLKNPLFAEFDFSDGKDCGFLCSIPPQGGSLNFSTLIPQGTPAAVAVGPDGAIFVACGTHVLKVAADGSRLLYDFLVSGGGAGTTLSAIAIDDSGRAWVTGSADYEFSPLLNPLQPSGGLHGSDLLLAQVNADGSALDFSTLLGGAGHDYGTGIDLGPDGAVCVAGCTNSGDFPVKKAATPGWGGDYDGLLLKIDPATPRVVYATYVGGAWEDRGAGLALAVGGGGWVAGLTTSHDLPVTGSFQDGLAGVKDAFIALLSADGSRWEAMSYFGGSLTSNHSEVGADWGNSLCLGPGGTIYMTGETFSSDFPMQNAIDPVYSLPKAFVTAFRRK